MKPPLASYLTDHLAGAATAVTLLASLTRAHRGTPASEVLRGLLMDIRADQRALKTLARGVGVSWSPKTLAAPFAAATVRLRTSRAAAKSPRFALFEGLELLVVGITGKRCLWRALHTVDHPAVRRLDLLALERRAENQLARAERLRISLAAGALTPAPRDAENGASSGDRGRRYRV